MLTGIKAVIFDMDGVIIDSEPLWRRAMIQSFIEIGIPFSDEHCRLTTGLRFKEVAEFWFTKHHISTITVADFDELVIKRLCDLIVLEGKAMTGVNEILPHLKENGFKIAIGTSSNTKLMNKVIEILSIGHYFDSLTSAEFLEYGKPHPHVFLNCAKSLAIHPSDCLVIEDSINGVIAAKAAQMKVVAIPEEINKNNPKFAIADFKVDSLLDIITTPYTSLKIN